MKGGVSKKSSGESLEARGSFFSRSDSEIREPEAAGKDDFVRAGYEAIKCIPTVQGGLSVSSFPDPGGLSDLVPFLGKCHRLRPGAYRRWLPGLPAYDILVPATTGQRKESG